MTTAIVDLNTLDQGGMATTCDVCIIGAGAAGLYLASRLADAGLDVAILEAGGLECSSGKSVGIEATLAGDTYRGATEGRAFGWGGTTSQWGGLLVPYTDLDLRNDSTLEARTWSHIVDVVQKHSNSVFARLGLRNKPDFLTLPGARLPAYAIAALRQAGFTTIAGDFLPFRRRNLSYLLSPHSRRPVSVYLRAVVSKWLIVPHSHGNGVVDTVQAVSRSGKHLTVAARSFVIAAGAIESARMLLEIDRATGADMLPRTATPGRCLADHLSCAIAEVHGDDRERTARLFGPVFVNGRMRGFRFVTSNVADLSRHFSHFIFDIDNAGFRLAKSILLSLQAKRIPSVRFPEFVSGFSDLLALGYGRIARSRLHIPGRTRAYLQMDIEQAPVQKNRVYLGDAKDELGRPVAIVDWRISDADHENIESAANAVLGKWPDASRGFPRLIRKSLTALDQKPFDCYHPVGTTRMGTDSGATVDLDLKVRGSSNLYILSTGVLPTAGTANPTFGMLCLGDRLATQLAKACHG